MNNHDDNKDQVLAKIDAMRAKVKSSKNAECMASMAEICMKKLAPEDVACCDCGQMTLQLNVHAGAANPWAKIQCSHIYPSGLACGFSHTCGHAKPPDPKLVPKF